MLRLPFVFLFCNLAAVKENALYEVLGKTNNPRPLLIDECHEDPSIPTTPREPYKTTKPDALAAFRTTLPTTVDDSEEICDTLLAEFHWYLVPHPDFKDGDPKKELPKADNITTNETMCFVSCFTDCCIRLLDATVKENRFVDLHEHIQQQTGFKSNTDLNQTALVSKRRMHYYHYCIERDEFIPYCQVILKKYLFDYYRHLAAFAEDDFKPKVFNYAIMSECDPAVRGYREYLCEYFTYLLPYWFHNESNYLVTGAAQYESMMEANNSFCSSQMPEGNFYIPKRYRLACYILLGTQTAETKFLNNDECNGLLNGFPTEACKSAYATCRLHMDEPYLEWNVKNISGVTFVRPIEYCKNMTEYYDVYEVFARHTVYEPDLDILEEAQTFCEKNITTLKCRAALDHLFNLKPFYEEHFYETSCQRKWLLCAFFAELFETKAIDKIDTAHVSSQCMTYDEKTEKCQTLRKICAKQKSPRVPCRIVLRTHKFTDMKEKELKLEEANDYLWEYCDGARVEQCKMMAHHVVNISEPKLLGELAYLVCLKPNGTITTTTENPFGYYPENYTDPCTPFLQEIARASHAQETYEPLCDVSNLTSPSDMCEYVFDACDTMNKTRNIDMMSGTGICPTLIERDREFFREYAKTLNKTAEQVVPILEKACEKNIEYITCTRLNEKLQKEKEFAVSLYKAICGTKSSDLCYATLKAHFDAHGKTLDALFATDCTKTSAKPTCAAITRYCEDGKGKADCFVYDINKCHTNRDKTQELCGKLAEKYCIGQNKDLKRCDRFFKEVFVNQEKGIRKRVADECEGSLNKNDVVAQRCTGYLEADATFNKGALIRVLSRELCSTKKGQDINAVGCKTIVDVCRNSSVSACTEVLTIFDMLQYRCQVKLDAPCRVAMDKLCTDYDNQVKVTNCETLLRGMTNETLFEAYKTECLEQDEGKSCKNVQNVILKTGRVVLLFDHFCTGGTLLSRNCRTIRTMCRKAQSKFASCDIVLSPYNKISVGSILGIVLGILLIVASVLLVCAEIDRARIVEWQESVEGMTTDEQEDPASTVDSDNSIETEAITQTPSTTQMDDTTTTAVPSLAMSVTQVEDSGYVQLPDLMTAQLQIPDAPQAADAGTVPQPLGGGYQGEAAQAPATENATQRF